MSLLEDSRNARQERRHALKSILVFLLGGILLFTTVSFADSVYSNGEIDDDLSFEDFMINDGYLTGFIVNTGKRTRPSVKLDVWTTNTMETRIYWRKTMNLGDLAPGARVAIKEPYQLDREDLARTKFMFRTPTPANYRNQPGQSTQAAQPKQETQAKETTQAKQGTQATPSKQTTQAKQATSSKQTPPPKQSTQAKQGTQATTSKQTTQVKQGTQPKQQ